VLNFSVRHRRIAYNPAAGFRKLPETREDMKFWERLEAETFLTKMSEKCPPGSEARWIYVVYLLALNTGLRAGEVWGLQPQDIVYDGELLHIRRRWDLITRDFRPPKGKVSRFVPCNGELRSELTRLIADRKIPDTETIFQSQNGTPICQDNFYDRIFKPDVVAGEVKDVRFHDLRHTATTLMIAEGLDIKTVQEICGHKDISTTMKYVHLLGDSIRKAASRFSIKPQTEQKNT
jgi:integrase